MNELRLSLPDHFGPYRISPFPKGPLRAARASVHVLKALAAEGPDAAALHICSL